MDQRVKQVVTEEAQQIKAVGKDAIKSRAYIYPVQVLNNNASREPC